MTDNDDDTPPPRIADQRRHYRTYPRGTPIVQELAMSNDDPTVTDERLDRLERQVASLLTSRKLWGRILGIVGPLLLGGIVTVLLWSADKIATSAERVGETRATIEGLRGRLDTQDRQIDQLRARLLQLSGGDTHAPSGDVPIPPDLFTLRDQGASTPASTPIGDAGLVLLQEPKLQNGQDFRIPNEHSISELHVDPQLDSGLTGRAALESLHAARSTSARMIFVIPYL